MQRRSRITQRTTRLSRPGTAMSMTWHMYTLRRAQRIIIIHLSRPGTAMSMPRHMYTLGSAQMIVLLSKPGTACGVMSMLIYTHSLSCLRSRTLHMDKHTRIYTHFHTHTYRYIHICKHTYMHMHTGLLKAREVQEWGTQFWSTSKDST